METLIVEKTTIVRNYMTGYSTEKESLRKYRCVVHIKGNDENAVEYFTESSVKRDKNGQWGKETSIHYWNSKTKPHNTVLELWSTKFNIKQSSL